MNTLQKWQVIFYVFILKNYFIKNKSRNSLVFLMLFFHLRHRRTSFKNKKKILKTRAENGTKIIPNRLSLHLTKNLHVQRKWLLWSKNKWYWPHIPSPSEYVHMLLLSHAFKLGTFLYFPNWGKTRLGKTRLGVF